MSCIEYDIVCGKSVICSFAMPVFFDRVFSELMKGELEDGSVIRFLLEIREWLLTFIEDFLNKQWNLFNSYEKVCTMKLIIELFMDLQKEFV